MTQYKLISGIRSHKSAFSSFLNCMA